MSCRFSKEQRKKSRDIPGALSFALDFFRCSYDLFCSGAALQVTPGGEERSVFRRCPECRLADCRQVPLCRGLPAQPICIKRQADACGTPPKGDSGRNLGLAAEKGPMAETLGCPGMSSFLTAGMSSLFQNRIRFLIFRKIQFKRLTSNRSVTIMKVTKRFLRTAE